MNNDSAQNKADNYNNTDSQPTTIFMIVGEPSGDVLGADLINQIGRMKDRPRQIHLCGILGPEMIAAAKQHHISYSNSIFDMDDIAVMGISAVIKHLRRIINRMKMTVKSICEKQPDIILSIDCPDFSLRVQKKIKKKPHLLPNTRHIHYVAPSVWAWRAGRAKKIAAFLDHLFCLFPFEPRYFQAHHLSASFLGHPAAMVPIGKIQSNETKKIETENKLVIGLYPGSRQSEIITHLPIMFEVIKKIINADDLKGKRLQFIIPGFDRFRQLYQSQIMQLPVHLQSMIDIIYDPSQKKSMMGCFDVALATNGTVGLELSMANIPHISLYKTSPLTYFLGKRLVKLKHIHLVNILFDHLINPNEKGLGNLVPEYIQDEINSSKISQDLLNLLNETNPMRQGQLTLFADARAHLSCDDKQKEQRIKAALF